MTISYERTVDAEVKLTFLLSLICHIFRHILLSDRFVDMLSTRVDHSKPTHEPSQSSLRDRHSNTVIMSLRGRGLLEIKPSSNPFFQTTTSEIGSKPPDSTEQWKVDGKVPPFQHGKHNVDGNFAFLYSRESDRIGSKVAKPIMKDTKLLTKTEFLKKKREEFDATSSYYQEQIDREESSSPGKRTAEDVLAVYRHIPKYEDPRYTTSTVITKLSSFSFCFLPVRSVHFFLTQSDYGKKPPSVATLVVDRAARPQGFSRSFNNVKPQNTSLTTSITRSNVHSSLDPQFA